MDLVTEGSRNKEKERTESTSPFPPEPENILAKQLCRRSG